MTLPVYVLAGGHSSRFGTDKARALLDGESLLRRAVRPLESFATDITIVADVAGKYDDLGYRTIVDREPDLGPLGGLWTALLDRPEPGWLFLTACDFVGARSAWADSLLAATRDDLRAVAFKHERWEPIFACYHTAAAAEIEASLKKGDRALWRLLDTVGASPRPLPDDWSIARSINTPEALEEYRRTHGG